MRDVQAIADRAEIEALRGEFTDAVVTGDYDRLALLFTPDSVVRIPHTRLVGGILLASMAASGAAFRHRTG